jgi:hypothetical protein
VAVRPSWGVKSSASLSASTDASALPGAARHLEVAGHGGDTAFELALESVTDVGRRQERECESVTVPDSGDGGESGGMATPVFGGIAHPHWRRRALCHRVGRGLGITGGRWGIADRIALASSTAMPA